MSAMRIGIDIGGTFTDLVLVDETSGDQKIFKLLTTHENPSDAVQEGFTALLGAVGAAPSEVVHVRHGTTLVTNAVLERQGGRVAFVTTDGFRDILEIATEDRYDMYDLEIEKPVPLVPRADVFTVVERIRSDGSVAVPLDEQSLAQVVDALVHGNYDSVGVCLLNSYQNPQHEEALSADLSSHVPGLAVSCSSQVSPEMREYVRASTTTVNAYVVPVFRKYIAQLEERLGSAGTSADLLLMLSSGGVCTTKTAAAFPVRLIESGPAAGALAAAAIARGGDVLSFDMGGTSAKASLIVGGEPLFTPSLRPPEVAQPLQVNPGLPPLSGS